MCMNLCVSWGGLAVLASDHRHSVALPDGVTRRHDFGRKLARLGNGLVSVGGKSAFAAVAMERLIAEQVDAADFEAVARCMRESADGMLVEVITRWPHADPTPPDDENGFLLLAANGEVGSVAWGGEIRLRGRGCTIFQYPPGFPKEKRDPRGDEFMAALSMVDTLGGIIRLIGAEFAYMARQCDAMSPTLDVAWQDSYLTGPASELATISDDAIQKWQQCPPVACVQTLSRTIRDYAAC